MNINEWIKFSDENIMTKKEVQEYLGMSDRGINQALYTERIKPIFSRGEGRSMVRLYYKGDVAEYKKQVEKQHERLNIKR